MNAIVETLNGWSASWWTYVLHASWQAAAVGIVALLIVYALRRLPAPWRYALLLVALVKFAVPPAVTTHLGLFYWAGPTVSTPAPSVPLPSTMIESESKQPATRPATSLAATEQSPPTTTASPTVGSPVSLASADDESRVAMISVARPTLSFYAWLMLGHGLGAVLVLGYIVVGMIQLIRLTRGASEINPADAGPLPSVLGRFEAMRRRLGIRDAVQLYVTDASIPPIAYWMGRPIVMVPRHLLDRLSADQLDAVLAHELIHHRRNDWAANFLQLLLTAAWWFHPVVWLLHRALNQTREECCDDAVVGSELAEAKAYGQTLIASAETLTRPRPIVATLGFAERLHPVAGRIKRIMDPKLWRVPRMSGAALVVVALIGVAVLPGVRSEAERPPIEAIELPDVLRLTIVEQETGQPIPHAKASAFFGGSNRALYEADEHGRVDIRYDAKHGFLRIGARADGRVPMGSNFGRGATGEGRSSDAVFPDSLTLPLPLGTEIGGVVVNEKGEPLEGAEIEVSHYGEGPGKVFVYSNEGGRNLPIATDSEGRWQRDTEPQDISDMIIHVTHEGFVRGTFQSGFTMPPIATLRDGTARFVLTPGVTLHGTVTDAAGKPIEGATIHIGEFIGSQYDVKTTTDEAGAYKIASASNGLQTVIIQAAGFAPQMRDVAIAAGMAPADFALDPGDVVRGRAVDHAGNPIANAYVGIDSWNGRQLWVWRSRTDAEGRFRWDHAPDGSLAFNVSKEGYRAASSVSILRGAPEATITLGVPVSIVGTVVDATSGEPIEEFVVVPGLGYSGLNQPQWWTGGRFTAENGQFEYRFDRPHEGYAVRIEAAGYVPVETRMIGPDEGRVEVALKMGRAASVQGQVVLSDGSAVADADVYRIPAGGQVMIRDSRGVMGMTHENFRTDAEGRFEMPPESAPWQLVVLHDQGYTELSHEQFAASNEVMLHPWARIEGVLRVGKRVGANEQIQIQTGRLDLTQRTTTIRYTNQVRTDERGRFLLDRVPHGTVRIARLLPESTPTRMGTQSLAVQRVESGQHYDLTLGGRGRSIQGQFIVPEGQTLSFKYTMGMIPHDFEALELNPPFPDGWEQMDQAAQAEWYRQWQATDEGRDYTEKLMEMSYQTHHYLVNADGSFTHDGLLPGKYRLTLMVADSSVRWTPIAHAQLPFEIPASDDPASEPALDLGQIELVMTQ